MWVILDIIRTAKILLLQYLYWTSEQFINMMKLTIPGRLLALNPGIPGAPGAPHPPANIQQIIKQVLFFIFKRILLSL